MPRRKRKNANFLKRALHMNELRRSRITLPEIEVVVEENKEQPTDVNEIIEDLDELHKPSADEGYMKKLTPLSVSGQFAEKSTIDKNTINDDSSVEVQIETVPASEGHPKFSIEGRRIINVSHFYSKLQEVANHGNMDCGLGCVEIVGEKKTGFYSLLTLQCKMCSDKFHVETDTPGDQMTVNHCAVAGTIAIGCGHSQLQEFSAALNLPIMTPKTYKACHYKLQDHWEKVSAETMNQAAAKERDIAIAEKRFDKNGIPMIDVIVDGCWSKRTYKKNYSALSGAAAIIGRKTGEVLYLGVKNKYCSICAQADKKNLQPQMHKCYKNYNGPSTAMESEILVEGFKCSIDMHNLIYARMVSDGDSSTYANLLKSRPYSHITIEKIECRNHILRNLCNKLAALKMDTKYLIKFRKVLTTKRTMILRKTIRKIIQKYKTDNELKRRCNIEPLYNDLLLAHNHAFDNHTTCQPYFCNTAGNTQLTDTEKHFYTSTLWSRICVIMANVAAHAPSLIHDIDSNNVERYNSIVAKLVGGKRVNFSKRGSYQVRCHAAVVSFNTHKVLSSVHKSIAGCSPRGSVKKLEERRMKQIRILRQFERKKNRILFAKAGDVNYGENCEKPDMPAEIFEKRKETFLLNLNKSEGERLRIERETVLQSSCSEWLELRRNLLTASNFGRVVNRRNNISCENLVKQILYKDTIAHVTSIKHGRENEKKALNQLAKQENVQITPCGLFIDREIQYLGATPDGLIADDTVVEIKCPITAFNKSVREAVENKKIPFYKINNKGEIVINQKHVWYYQIQGQLHITNKSKCLFAIWTGDDQPIWTEIILKDDIFFAEEMKDKLCRFYMECLLPELVDPRHPRNQKIRDPEFITVAMKENKKKGNLRSIKRKRVENQEIAMKDAKDSHDGIDIMRKREKKQKTLDKENTFDIQIDTSKQKSSSDDSAKHENDELPLPSTIYVRNLQFEEF